MITNHFTRNRFSVSPKVTRQVSRHSAATVSDDEISSTSETDNPKTPRAKKLLASHVVTEPKHKSATKYRSSATASLANVGEFLEQKAKLEQQRFELLQQRERERQADAAAKREREEKQQRVEMARLVVSTDGADEEVKVAAKKFLINLFTF